MAQAKVLTNAEIDKVVREVVEECYQRTKNMLAEKKHLI
jgi:ATP-dependent Zn protease